MAGPSADVTQALLVGMCIAVLQGTLARSSRSDGMCIDACCRRRQTRRGLPVAAHPAGRDAVDGVKQRADHREIGESSSLRRRGNALADGR